MPTRSTRVAEVIARGVARRGAALMGICNVTPDSFSDGGKWFDRHDACGRVDTLLAEGADLIDIGGESTRPGSRAVSAKDQLARILPVIEHAAKRGACISVDTRSADVAAAALDAGAHAVNDVSLLEDEDLARVCAGSGAMLVLSHARSLAAAQLNVGREAQGYGDVVADVAAEWERAATRAGELGVPRSSLIMDPGLGFSKSARHSFELLRRASQLVAAVGAAGEVALLFGASRKSFLGLIDPPGAKSAPEERDGASIAAALHAVRAGVHVLRVHDVRATRQALDLEHALLTTRRKI